MKLEDTDVKPAMSVAMRQRVQTLLFIVSKFSVAQDMLYNFIIHIGLFMLHEQTVAYALVLLLQVSISTCRFSVQIGINKCCFVWLRQKKRKKSGNLS